MSQQEFVGCSAIEGSYSLLEKLGEGTFGEVHKARRKSTGQLVALKRIFMHNEKEGFPLTALREIRVLKDLSHENVIPLVEMVVGAPPEQSNPDPRPPVYMVTPYMDHDLSGLLQNPSVKLSLPHIKLYMKQLLEGMKYLHERQYLHRDIKTANILIDNNGTVKIADFGLARKYYDPPPKAGAGAGPGKYAYTSMVVTRWYRPPELILGEAKYTTAIDMWGIGCVFGEMFKGAPILQGVSDIDQGHRIFKLLGSPSQDTMPGFDQLPGGKMTYGPYHRQFESVFKELDSPSLSLLGGLLDINPLTRLTAVGALAHRFFTTDPLPATKDKLPRYQDSHEMNAKSNFRKAIPHAPNVDPSQHAQKMGSNNGYDQPFAMNLPPRPEMFYDHPPPYRQDTYRPHNNNRHYHDNNNRDRHYRGDRHNRRNRRNHNRPPPEPPYKRRGGHQQAPPPPPPPPPEPPYRSNRAPYHDHSLKPPYRKDGLPPLPPPPPPPPMPQYDDDNPGAFSNVPNALNYDEDVKTEAKRRRKD